MKAADWSQLKTKMVIQLMKDKQMHCTLTIITLLFQVLKLFFFFLTDTNCPGCFLRNIIIIHLLNCTNEIAYNCVCIIHKSMKEKLKQYVNNKIGSNYKQIYKYQTFCKVY